MGDEGIGGQERGGHGARDVSGEDVFGRMQKVWWESWEHFLCVQQKGTLGVQSSQANASGTREPGVGSQAGTWVMQSGALGISG